MGSEGKVTQASRGSQHLQRYICVRKDATKQQPCRKSGRWTAQAAGQTTHWSRPDRSKMGVIHTVSTRFYWLHFHSPSPHCGPEREFYRKIAHFISLVRVSLFLLTCLFSISISLLLCLFSCKRTLQSPNVFMSLGVEIFVCRSVHTEMPVAITTRWTAMWLCINIHGPRRMNPLTFSPVPHFWLI